MIRYCILLSFIFLAVAVQAQEITLKGRVSDASQNAPLEFANISLLRPADSTLISGGMTDLEGAFEFGAPAGSYILRVGFIGYQNYFESIVLGAKPTVNLGVVKLEADTQNLNEVVVEGVKSIFESDVDKRIYNVENNILATGATASELLATLPSIQVDDEGGISMRGSGNILIYINGRPSNLSGDDMESILSQFPANSIKEVELITNPSARYDAAGVGGIINIILKKNEQTGFNGQVNASVGTREKYQAGINLNYGKEKANYFFSYNWQDRREIESGSGTRISDLEGFSPVLDQDQDGLEFEKNHLIRTGADWTLGRGKILGFYFQGNFETEEEYEDIDQRNIGEDGIVDSSFVRRNEEIGRSKNLEGGLNYTWEIDSLGQKLYSSLSYAYDDRHSDEYYRQQYYSSAGELNPTKGLVQTNVRPSQSELVVAQLDYEKPLGEFGSMEAGLKGTFANWISGQTFATGDVDTDFVPIVVDSLNESYDYTENVYAAYLTFKRKKDKIGYQFGLRAEQTNTLGKTVKGDTEIPNDYFNLFPSAYLTYEVGKESEFSLNYSRRVSRPRIWDLAPIYRVRDQYNLSIGNPYLQPEFTDSYEFGYRKGWEKYLLNATAYHRYSTDVETRITYLTDDNVAIQTRQNADTRISSGLELINQVQLARNFDATLTGNFFYSKVNGENIEEGFSNENFSWTVTLLGNVLIPKWFSFQFQGNYRGPIVQPQGEILPQWSLNLGLSKNVLAGRGTINLNVSDVFNTRNFRIETVDPRFIQTRTFQRETRIGTLSFTYRFGGYKEKSEGRSSREGGDDLGGEEF
ncbi:TonB-dependent receptor [Algoriphagus aestuariicola]|uniref:TonB-dependent receptor n=1 Tax=Algoriphagus aestuariicola TaxID=1852016 RepID=A0ABS3BRT0_9BACT|nr:outer membrane beta-barrel family protein [Algoriphagus aestuariicola]MBN7801984.1 TonB-dependent receptor [Algoriphagus aestuariicola]